MANGSCGGHTRAAVRRFGSLTAPRGSPSIAAMGRRAAVAVAGAYFALAAFASPARAYDFEVRALSVGQGYQLRLFRPLTGDVLANRRRFTQTLTLDIWNIGKAPRYALYDARLEPGANYFVSAFVRIDHDFGEYTRDDIDVGARRFDATDLIPELQGSNLALDVLYAYGGGRGIAGVFDVEVGRQLMVQSLDWWSFDGALVRAHTPWHLSVEAFAGTRVLDSSPAGSAAHEPDGTGCAQFAEDVAGAGPGRGALLRTQPSRPTR